MAWYSKIRSLFGQQPVHEAAGRGRRSLAWMPGNPGAVAAMLATNTELRIKSRDLVRRNAWAQAGIEAFVSNAVGTGIKPQSLAADERSRPTCRRCGVTGRRKPTPQARPISTACRRWPAARCSKAVNA
jgi:capsid protein